MRQRGFTIVDGSGFRGSGFGIGYRGYRPLAHHPLDGRLRVSGFVFAVEGFGFGISCIGFRVSYRGFRGYGPLRGGLVFKAHRLRYHSTLGSSVTKKKKVCV